MHTTPRLGRTTVAPLPAAGGAVVTPAQWGGLVAQERGAFAMFGALTGIATLTAALVVGGAVVGYAVDRATSAPHVFVFLGLVLGIVVAVLSVRSIVRRFFG